MNKYGKITLENLLKSGYALEQRQFLNTFTPRDRPHILDAIARLESELMISRDYSEDGITIVLPQNKITEAFRMVSTIKFDEHEYTPIEELIPKKYSAPFLIKEGEKKIHGKVSKYVFCHTYKDPYDVTCFVINYKGDMHPIHLGSVFDPTSKISLFLKEIDAKFKNILFTREDLKTNLPKKLIQNNQPTKAVIEYLCHEKFLIRFDYDLNRWSKFQRTGKIHPITLIDEIIATTHDIVKPTIATFGGAKYAYHEEDGFYPVLL